MRLDVTVSAVAVKVFPTASRISPLTSTETVHVTVSPLEGVLPSWPVVTGREISVLPVWVEKGRLNMKPPVPAASMVRDRVLQSTSLPEAVQSTVTRIVETFEDPE